MTDVSKGRSAVTLKHLRGLMEFFRLRASYWLDETRLEPLPFDRLDEVSDESLRKLEAFGLHDVRSFEPTLQKIQRFVASRRSEWEDEHGLMSEADRRLLGVEDDEELRLKPLLPETAEPKANEAASVRQAWVSAGRTTRITTSRCPRRN